MAQDTVSLDQVINDFILSIEGDDYINTASEVMVRNLALRGIREMGFDILKRINGEKHLVGIDVLGQGKLHDETIYTGIPIERVHLLEQILLAAVRRQLNEG